MEMNRTFTLESETKKKEKEVKIDAGTYFWPLFTEYPCLKSEEIFASNHLHNNIVLSIQPRTPVLSPQ